ncbi:MAG: hypothetical protein WEA82_04705 [Idiomarina sp.]
MSKILSLLLLFVSVDCLSSTCVSRDEINDIQGSKYADLINVEMERVDKKYSIYVSVSSNYERLELDSIFLTFADAQMENIELVVPLELKSSEEGMTSLFIIHEKYLDGSWLGFSYGDCGKEFYIRLRDYQLH